MNVLSMVSAVWSFCSSNSTNISLIYPYRFCFISRNIWINYCESCRPFYRFVNSLSCWGIAIGIYCGIIGTEPKFSGKYGFLISSSTCWFKFYIRKSRRWMKIRILRNLLKLFSTFESLKQSDLSDVLFCELYSCEFWCLPNYSTGALPPSSSWYVSEFLKELRSS